MEENFIRGYHVRDEIIFFLKHCYIYQKIEGAGAR